MRDRGISESLAVDLMLEHYNPRCIPEWEDDDLTKKIQNAYSYATGDAGSRSIVSNFLERDPAVGEDDSGDGPARS